MFGYCLVIQQSMIDATKQCTAFRKRAVTDGFQQDAWQ